MKTILATGGAPIPPEKRGIDMKWEEMTATELATAATLLERLIKDSNESEEKKELMMRAINRPAFNRNN